MSRILVARTSEDFIKELAQLLDQEYFELIPAENKDQALDLLSKENFDLVVIDHYFPEKTSLMQELVTEIREIPIIVITERSEEGEFQPAHQIQGFLELGKFELGLLPNIIRHLISQSKVLEHILQEEKKYHQLFHQVDYGMIMLNPQGKIEEVNGSACRILDRTKEELVGKTFLELACLDSVFASLFSALSQHHQKHFPYRAVFESKDKYIWVNFYFFSIAGQEYALVSLSDLAWVKQAQKKLEVSQERYQQIFENLGTMIVVINEQGRIIDANRWLENWLGISRKKLKNLNVAKILVQQGHQEWLAQVQNALESEGIYRGELELEVRGKKRVVGMTISRFKSEKEAWGYLAGFQDITYRKRLRETQRQLQWELVQKSHLASLGNLIQGITHNLNNPLAIIKSTVDYLLEVKPEPEEILEELEIIQQQVQRMNQLLKDLTVKSRKEALQVLSRLDLNQVLEEELNMMSHHPFFKYEVKLEKELKPLPLIRGIYSDFSQTFSNLIKNALDAMQAVEEKILRVRSRTEAGNIVIEIQDSGVGIEKELIPRLFDPFFTTKPLTGQEGKPSGVGLGLYTCRLLIEPYGGRFEVESEVGKGSIFRLRIPTQPLQASKILLLSQNDGFLSILDASLRFIGQKVVSEKEFKNIIDQEEHFDYFVIDLESLGEKWRERVEMLVSFCPQANFILLTNQSPELLGAQLHLNIPYLILQKPIQTSEISQALALIEAGYTQSSAGF